MPRRCKVVSFDADQTLVDFRPAMREALELALSTIRSTVPKAASLTNQHSASTLQEPGSVRAQRFGIIDDWQPLEVQTVTLDSYGAGSIGGPDKHARTLLKIDHRRGSCRDP